MKAQTILRISTVLSESILLMKYETRWLSRLRISHPAQVDGCGCAFEIYSGWKMTTFTMPKKWQKLIQQLLPIHMHILVPWGKHAKFQNNWYKTVRGVALTRDTLCLYNQGEKWLSSQCRKSDKNWSNNYVQSTCTSSYYEENTCKVSKQLVQNCKRSCTHKIPMLNVDWWTDGRTNGWKLARLCLPAKAGATKIHLQWRHTDLDVW